MSPQIKQSKAQLRNLFKSLRKGLSEQRRKDAAEKISSAILQKTSSNFQILSFASMPDEIDTSIVNAALARQNRLYLPRVVGGDLEVYHCSHLDSLSQSALGILEPDPLVDRKTHLNEIDMILVPGLSFDKDNRRLGYGKGFYDRLIHKARDQNPRIKIIGICFIEQLYEGELPQDDHDEKVDEVFVF